MAETPHILSYEHVTEPPVRGGRAALGCAILALEAALLLAYRYIGEPAMAELPLAGVGRREATALATAVYSLLSVCVPAGVWFLAGAKPARMEAGRVAGAWRGRAALGIAAFYSGLRLVSGAIWIQYIMGRGAAGELRHGVALLSCASILALATLQAAGWLYMADVSARLRRRAFLPLATAAFGVSLALLGVALAANLDALSPMLTPELRGAARWVARGTALSIVQTVYWAVTAGMLMPRRWNG